MYKYILEGAGDINWMAIFALVTFFLLFVIVLITTYRTQPSTLNRLANLPLDDRDPLTFETADRHEK
jgi:hypothetical protein